MENGIRDGVFLKEWRRKRGLTGEACAAAFGLSRRTLTAYEALEGAAIPGKILARMESFDTGEEVAPVDDFAEPKPVKVTKAPRARSGDVAAPVKITGQNHRGLNIGEDGKLYGRFERVSDQPKLAKVLAGTGARWTEFFPSANGVGAGRTILWGVLKGEGEGDCAPVLAGQHYHPWRANVGRQGGEVAPARPEKAKRRA